MVRKKLYGRSAKDHGTLGFFCCLLNRSTVTADVKRAVDDTLDFLEVVIKEHFLAVACRILGITSINDKVVLPSGTFKVDASQQLQYIDLVATQVVQQCTLIDTNVNVWDTDDSIYSYARVLCHYGALNWISGMLSKRVMESVCIVVGMSCYHTSLLPGTQSIA